MDIIYIVTCLLISSLSLAIFSNRARARYTVDFELKPNCLLTRWPLVFVTGPRSLFYFSAYWNLYTSYLAEHGYEVFTLHLPWSNPQQRQERLAAFLSEQSKAHRHFHFFMDEPTLQEFEDFLRQSKASVIKSVTEISDTRSRQAHHPTQLSAPPFPTGLIECQPSNQGPMLLRWAYRLHRLFFQSKHLNSLSTLGAAFDGNLDNCQKLLQHTQHLAEMDLREDS